MPYRSFANWLIPETQYKTLFLDHDMTLSPIQPKQTASFIYQAEDFDVFVQLRKADRNGKLLQNINIPPEDLGVQAQKVETINPLKYLGPSGILRASHREIDQARSKPHWPLYPHTTKKLVPAGEIVRLEIGIWPTAIRFEAGEKLVLKVAGHNMTLAEFPFLRGKAVNFNKGAHNLFVGPGNLSSLTIPIVELE
jgi:predicted acyl esterase